MRDSQTVASGAGVHQTALYDFFIALGLFLVLYWLNRRPRREGVLILTFAIWYGVGRLITDFLRIDKTYFGLTGSQLTSIAAVVVSVIVLVRFARRPVPAAAPATEEELEPAAVEDDRPTTDFEPPSTPGTT